MNILLTEYDEKKRRRLDRKEGYEDGLLVGEERGYIRGEEHGIQIGEERGIQIGDQQRLTQQIQKKLTRGMPLEQIAAELEEDVEVIRPIYEKLMRH